MVQKKRERNTGSRRNDADFSNRTVLFLLVLVILVSIISVILYVQTLNSVQPKFMVNQGQASGEVAITILPPPEATTDAEGEVAITIVEPPTAPE